MNTPRLPFLDGLRVAAFALLIPYHVGMYYVTWDWHVKSPAASSTLEPFMQLSSPWRLSLLFLIAGAACHGLFAKRGALGTLKDRSLRLLLPLLFGMAVIVTPQAYFEVLTRVPAQLPGDGGYLDFWAAYLRSGRYCRGDDCMIVPTWNHLWFLPYLWVYAVLGAALASLRLTPRAVKLPAWAWLLAPAVPLALLRIFVMPHWPTTHDLVHDLYTTCSTATCSPLAGPAARRWRRACGRPRCGCVGWRWACRWQRGRCCWSSRRCTQASPGPTPCWWPPARCAAR